MKARIIVMPPPARVQRGRNSLIVILARQYAAGIQQRWKSLKGVK